MAGETILIIEDNPMNMELVTDLLHVAGFVLIQARTAEEGLSALTRSEKPALVLMDIGLPGMDGLAATKALKRAAETRSIPVLALTSHAMKGDEEEALAAGCIGYITKPIDTRTFPQTVARYIELSRIA